MRDINQIIIHCSYSKTGNAAVINQWHLDRGWDGIGYHYIILKNGLIEKGRELHKIGAHCKGQNSDSIGICMIGNSIEDMTQIQHESARQLVAALQWIFGDLKLYGHNHYNKYKTCPTFDVKDLFGFI